MSAFNDLSCWEYAMEIRLNFGRCQRSQVTHVNCLGLQVICGLL